MSVDDVLAQRGAVYGNFHKQARLTSALKAAMYSSHPDAEKLSPDMLEALDMIAVKIARIINGDPNYIDNWDDIAGYATLVANRLRAEQATASARK